MEPLPHLPIPDWTPELDASFISQGKIEESPDGCFIWTGPIFMPGGYGRFYIPSGEKGKAGRSYRAHRVIYAWLVGDPGEAVLDHICHDPLECFDSDDYCIHRRCVNPDHLVPTTRGDNVRRGLPGSPLWHPQGNSLKQISARGHDLDYVDPRRGWRESRVDRAAATARYRERNREEINATRRANRQRITYDPRPCLWCGTVYQPMRSDSRYCTERACINDRQRANRNKRLA